jgi:hypothetical protein
MAQNTGCDGAATNRFDMAGISFLMALLFGVAALLFRQAAEQIHSGTSWAHDVCSSSQMFCHHPEYLAYAGGVLLIVAVGAKLGSMAS